MNSTVSRRKHVTANRRRRIHNFKFVILLNQEKRAQNVEDLIRIAGAQTTKAHLCALDILADVDEVARKDRIMKALVRKERKRKQAEQNRIDSILAPYVKAWMNKRGRPIVGGMGFRRIVKISLREPNKIFVHYEDKCFHQVVRWDLNSRYLPDISDMIIEDKRYEKTITDKS